MQIFRNMQIKARSGTGAAVVEGSLDGVPRSHADDAASGFDGLR